MSLQVNATSSDLRRPVLPASITIVRSRSFSPANPMSTNTTTEYRNLPFRRPERVRHQPRRIFEDSALKEFAESIRSQGFFLFCLSGLSPTRALRLSPGPDAIVLRRWPKRPRFRSAFSASYINCPVREPMRPALPNRVFRHPTARRRNQEWCLESDRSSSKCWRRLGRHRCSSFP
jgi:hypothetical protein